MSSASGDGDGHKKKCRGHGDGTDDEGSCEITVGDSKRSRTIDVINIDDDDDGVKEDDSMGEDDGGLAEEPAAADADDYDNGSGEEYYMYDDEEGNDDGDDEYAAATAVDDDASASAHGGKPRYTVLSEDDIRKRQAADVAKVAEVLSIPPDFAVILLRHFKWAPGRVQEEWFSDERRVRAAVGLPESADGGVGKTAMAVADRRAVCGICFDGYSAGRKLSAGCAAHFYCRACWRGYLRAAVGDGARCLALRCPEPGCSAAVVAGLVGEVADAADKARYAAFALRSYVEDNGGGRAMRWCPAPGCTRAVAAGEEAEDQKSSEKALDVACECGHAFCFRCGEEAHRPVTCGTVRAWLAKNASDSETANWVLANTKYCPSCRKPIEKNQGCNHMSCRCGHYFCWLCLDPLGGSQHRGCDAYRQQHPKTMSVNDRLAWTTTAAEARRKREAKASLDRYLYHYERWASNLSSLHRARKDVAELEKSGLQKLAAAAGMPATELAFLTKAYEQVADGRRVLRWAHAYGYYLDPKREGAKRALFEELQAHANACLERLHACAELERKQVFGDGKEEVGVVYEKVRAYREKLVNLTRVTGTFLENLVMAFETDLPEVAALK
ncbi:hypothetical protein EJB05_25994, partial [Eragrostis curvula]